MSQKVIIWGHKLHTHTHSYIHSSYYKAFKYMGFDTYWFDDSDIQSGSLNNFDFENCIFFTEDQRQANIPLVKSAKYILHHTNLEKYNANGLTYINLGNYSKWCEDGISANHKENTVEKIGDCAFWDAKSKTLYQPWATDLLPSEIDIDNISLYDPNKDTIYYTGTIHDNSDKIMQFMKVSNQDNKKFELKTSVSDEDNYKYTKESYISFDLRSDWHLEYGYVPCRVFKNISYGKWVGTNSETVYKIFGDFVTYEPNINNLYTKIVQDYKNMDIKKMREAMTFVKDKHTFVNRINNLLKLLNYNG